MDSAKNDTAQIEFGDLRYSAKTGKLDNTLTSDSAYLEGEAQAVFSCLCENFGSAVSIADMMLVLRDFHPDAIPLHIENRTHSALHELTMLLSIINCKQVDLKLLANNGAQLRLRSSPAGNSTEKSSKILTAEFKHIIRRIERHVWEELSEDYWQKVTRIDQEWPLMNFTKIALDLLAIGRNSLAFKEQELNHSPDLKSLHRKFIYIADVVDSVLVTITHIENWVSDILNPEREKGEAHKDRLSAFIQFDNNFSPLFTHANAANPHQQLVFAYFHVFDLFCCICKLITTKVTQANFDEYRLHLQNFSRAQRGWSDNLCSTNKVIRHTLIETRMFSRVDDPEVSRRIRIQENRLRIHIAFEELTLYSGIMLSKALSRYNQFTDSGQSDRKMSDEFFHLPEDHVKQTMH